MATLTISKLAKAAGVEVSTIRYYERRGLVTPAARRSSGYREYGSDAVRKVRFIRHAQADLARTCANAHSESSWT